MRLILTFRLPHHRRGQTNKRALGFWRHQYVIVQKVCGASFGEVHEIAHRELNTALITHQDAYRRFDFLATFTSMEAETRLAPRSYF